MSGTPPSLPDTGGTEGRPTVAISPAHTCYELLFASRVFTDSTADLLDIILKVYVIKALIAAADTPLCYLGINLTRRATGVDPRQVL